MELKTKIAKYFISKISRQMKHAARHTTVGDTCIQFEVDSLHTREVIAQTRLRLPTADRTNRGIK